MSKGIDIEKGNSFLFTSGSEDDFLRWRDWKLSGYPAKVEDLIVEIGNLRNPTESEIEKIRYLIQKTGMALYHCPEANLRPETDLKAFGSALGLVDLDSNFFAEDGGFSEIRVNQKDGRGDYIPYTTKPIQWHTDGYYNPPERRIRGLLLHCQTPAIRGGVSQILDPEIVYLRMRETDREALEALFDGDAMTIPAHILDGVEHRPVSTGPVFLEEGDGSLLMRYTARKKNIEWKEHSKIRKAVELLRSFMRDDSPFVFEAKLIGGQGLISNNVLHNRSGFEEDEEHPRVFFRLRYYNRIRIQ